MHEHQHEGNGRKPSPESLARRHEQLDLSARSIAQFLAILTFVLGAAGLAVVGLFYMLSTREARREPPASPLAMSELQVPPEPRLQALPSVDLARMRAENATALTTYGWVSREAGLVRVPIERAMEQVAQRGLPLWPITPPEQSQAGSPTETPAATEPAAATEEQGAAPAEPAPVQTPGAAPVLPPLTVEAPQGEAQ